MGPKAYEVTESVAGFIEGEILRVAEEEHGHADEMVLELDPFAAEPVRVIVSDTVTGFSERDIFEASSRFGDWQETSLTFEAGTVGSAVTSSEPVQLTMSELSAIADPVEATG